MSLNTARSALSNLQLAADACSGDQHADGDEVEVEGDVHTAAERALALVEICMRVLIHLDDYRDRARAARVSRTFRAAAGAPPLWREVVLGSGSLEWLTTKKDFIDKYDGRRRKGISLSRVLKVVAGRPVAHLTVFPLLSMTDRSLQMMMTGSELLRGVDTRHLTSLDLRHSYAGERVADVVHSRALPALKELDLRGCLYMPQTFVTCPTLRVFRFMWEEESEIRAWTDSFQCESLKGRNGGYVVYT